MLSHFWGGESKEFARNGLKHILVLAFLKLDETVVELEKCLKWH